MFIYNFLKKLTMALDSDINRKWRQHSICRHEFLATTLTISCMCKCFDVRSVSRHVRWQFRPLRTLQLKNVNVRFWARFLLVIRWRFLPTFYSVKVIKLFYLAGISHWCQTLDFLDKDPSCFAVKCRSSKGTSWRTKAYNKPFYVILMRLRCAHAWETSVKNSREGYNSRTLASRASGRSQQLLAYHKSPQM